MVCDKCLQPTQITVSSVLGGKFGQYCTNCYEANTRPANAASASYNRDRDREAHEGDMVQPWVNGRANREFHRLYPDQAREMFSKEELREM